MVLASRQTSGTCQRPSQRSKPAIELIKRRAHCRLAELDHHALVGRLWQSQKGLIALSA